MSLTPLSLSDPMFDKLSDAIMKSYPNACILWIEQVENPALKERYNAYKCELEKQIGNDNTKELQLFHGSSKAAIQSIINNGFDAGMNKTSAYGIGSYFAVNASYSKSYARNERMDDNISYMILCNVCVGRTCQGVSNRVIDSTKYENFVDNTVSPTIYVAPHDASIYPAYIIAFYK